jgi:ATP-dependent DNA helicase RecG
VLYFSVVSVGSARQITNVCNKAIVMILQDLKNLIALGEGQTSEFKRSHSDDFGRELSSFANSIGGTLLIGVEDSGTLIGVQHPNRIKAQIQNTARNLEPPLRVHIESVGNVIVVTVPRSDDCPHSSGGRYYIREGATCQQMTRSQIREYFLREGTLLFDTMVNRDFNVTKDLVKKTYAAFAAAAGIPATLDMHDSLRNLKLLSDKGMTNAGALLLGGRGSRFLVSATVMCALFQGTTKTKILDQKLFDEDLVSNYQNALLYLQSHLNTEYIITAERKNKLELPVEALREAVINAIAHRDYRSPANIQIFIFNDRVEIHNPGGLVAGLKIADLGKRSVPRNPLLFGMLYRMDLVEHIGSGLRRIRDTMKEYGLKAPDIEADEHWFAVTFARKPMNKSLIIEKDSQKKKTGKLGEKLGEKFGETRTRILQAIAENNYISIVSLAEKIGISTTAIEKNIFFLKKNGYLKRIGPDKGGYWKIVE